MSCNLGTIIGGPALVKFKGQTFFSKSDIQLSSDIETFNVEADAFGGTVEEREANAPISLSFTPAGVWAALSVLWPYGNPVIGGSIMPVTTITAVDTGANSLEVVNHRLRDGAPVRLATFGTLPAPLDGDTLYYAHVIDADNISLHTSEADALAASSPIDLSDDGEGESTIIEQEPLIIHTLTGRKITFHVAAVTQMPDFLGSAVQTPIGAVTFECFRKNAVEATEDESRYTVENEAFDLAAAGFDPADVITQPYTAGWGNAAPWDEFESKDGFRVSFPIELTPIENDRCGVIGRRLSSVRAEVRAKPTNANESTLLTALGIQGSGAGRGRRIAGDDLIVQGEGVYVRVYGASLKRAPQSFSSKDDRAGELQWVSARTFSGGVPGPVFSVATSS